MVFEPLKPVKSLFTTRLEHCRNLKRPTDFAEEANFLIGPFADVL